MTGSWVSCIVVVGGVHAKHMWAADDHVSRMLQEHHMGMGQMENVRELQQALPLNSIQFLNSPTPPPPHKKKTYMQRDTVCGGSM